MNDVSTRADGRTAAVSLGEAKTLIRAMAHEESILLLSPPGLGKSEIVRQAAAEAGIELKALYGAQLAPEDIGGIPHIVGGRTVFCPPRILLPEGSAPICLLLDELPSCSPDVQKALSALLLERRLGEHRLPAGSWVVAAGNRLEDRALVRAMSSALVNRVFLIDVRVDLREWLMWARGAFIHPDILAFLTFMPEALMRPVPVDPAPFSTPRAWTSLSRALQLAEHAGVLGMAQRRALAFGRVSAGDAAVFCAAAETGVAELRPPLDYLQRPDLVPRGDGPRWLVLSAIRSQIAREDGVPLDGETISRFLAALPPTHRFAVLIGLVERWQALGAAPSLMAGLKEATGL
jgi:hypothetical protein